MTTVATSKPAEPRSRRGVRVRGVVQGVGFRPTVYRLALAAGVAGFVRNDAEGVWIEIEGGAGALTGFLERLVREPPPLGRIDAVEVIELPPAGDQAFAVEPSAAGTRVDAIVPADAATCDACLRELFDPANRRARYPFINCTDCGPRYTIVEDVPYDRARTTMAAFALCDACRAEYLDPGDRRFHAEPNACPTCGPRLAFAEPPAAGASRTGAPALAAAVAALRAGRIVAVKGIGGYHLAVDAADEAAVQRLRARKQRPDKPLAVMACSLAEAERRVVLDAPARAALTSPARPIVLSPARPGAPLAPGVAPGLGELGLMLPYAPLHHLLFDGGPPVLVMTSGNRAEEPIARTEAEARAALDGIADALLTHDREIHTRADDSVLRIVAGGAQPVRRSRGLVPASIDLGVVAPPICAVGAHLKNVVCLTRGSEATLSPHVGDLDNPATLGFFAEVIDKLQRLLGVEPAIVAHDLHPDYASTRWALASGRPREAVQHHHAHVAACLTDNGHFGPVLGVAFDGTGCGPAGDAWGGEFLRSDLLSFTRLAHLRPLALPGGEAAIREPWRLALAALDDAGVDDALLARVPAARRAAVRGLCARAPRATGAGRWFDAVAALCGVRDRITYEGQAAVELEALAAPDDGTEYPFDLEAVAAGPAVFDLRPTVRALAADLSAGVGAPRVAARFHRTMARTIQAAARRFGAPAGLSTVALSGGCFQNRILTETTADLLAAEGLAVLVHRRTPPNDGGVALGQAAVAAHRWQHRTTGRAHVPRHPG